MATLTVLRVLMALHVAALAASAQIPLTILHSFSGGSSEPSGVDGPLVQGADGNFYVVSKSGGAFGWGAVFSLSPDGVVTRLYSFFPHHNPADYVPETLGLSGGLIQATNGNLYGTMRSVGPAYDPYGSVFWLPPRPIGIIGLGLRVFRGPPTDGADPVGRLIQASDGYLYGVTRAGGSAGLGTIFRLSLGGSSSTVASFDASSLNSPTGGLAEGLDGRIYGTLSGGVFAFQPGGAVSIVATIPGVRGELVRQPGGDFYGVTATAIFTMTPAGAVTTLHTFAVAGTRRLVVAADGSLYITQEADNSSPGALLRLTPPATLRLLYTFSSATGDPRGSVIQAQDGNLYGVTGSIFYRVTPPAASGDFDYDGKTDMLRYEASSGVWRILTSANGWTSSRMIALGGAGYTPVPADYDGDGRLDIAVYHAATGEWHVLTSGSGFTTPGNAGNWGGTGYVPVPGDYDGDRKADLAVYRPTTGNWHVVLSSSGSTTGWTLHEGGPNCVPVSGDYDGDRLADLATYEPATGLWRLRTSSSEYTATVTKTLGGLGFAPVPGDYDGDGAVDAAVYDEANGLWQVLGSSSSASTPWTIGWGGSGYTAVAGDYDGDGLCDPAVYAAASGRWYVLLSAEHYTTSLAVEWGAQDDTIVTSTPPRIAWNDALRASDGDGDGVSDLIVYEQTTGEWRVLPSSSRFNATVVMWWGGTGYTPAPGDYDGDGVTDLGVYRSDSGVWSVLLSSSGRTSTLSVPWGGPGYDPVPGDYDGDLRTDIAVYAPATSTWHLLLSSSGFTVARNVVWGTPGDVTVPADFDGDGLTDLGVYTPAAGQWRVALGASGYATSISMAWGGSGHTAVARDFDGDGRADFAACDRAGGLWHVLLTGQAYTSAMSVSWGHAIDTPLSADYDADGIADPVSYDSATGGWSVGQSTSGNTIMITRTLGGPGYVALPR